MPSELLKSCWCQSLVRSSQSGEKYDKKYADILNRLSQTCKKLPATEKALAKLRQAFQLLLVRECANSITVMPESHISTTYL